MPHKRTKLIEKSCVVCGSIFDVCPQGKTSRFCTTPYDAKYCSRICRQRARFRQGAIGLKLTPTQAAYIAGFLDGEGSVILYMRRDSVALRVSFSNTKLEPLNWIKEAVGMGSIIIKHHTNLKHRASAMYQLNSDAAAQLLKQVLPYLVLKHEQAEIAINFQDNLHTPSLKANRDWQYKARSKMQKLNKRGN